MSKQGDLDGYWNIYARKINGNHEWGLHSGPFTEALVGDEVIRLAKNRPSWEFKTKFFAAPEVHVQPLPAGGAVKSAQIKEALALLPKLGALFADAFAGANSGKPTAALSVVRAALEVAQREAEAWEAIEAFCKSHPLVGPSLNWTGVVWMLEITNENNDWVFSANEPTRLEALTKAAAWCSAEMTK